MARTHGKTFRLGSNKGPKSETRHYFSPTKLAKKKEKKRKSVLAKSLGARHSQTRLVETQLGTTFQGRFGNKTNMLVSKALNARLCLDPAIPLGEIYPRGIIKDVLANLATEGTL